MLPPELHDVVIGLLQQNGNVFLGWEYSVPLEAVPGYMAGKLFRVTDFEERGRILHVKPDGAAPADAHRHTFDNYGRMFEAMQVARIQIAQPSIPGIKHITLSTGYSQPVRMSGYHAPPTPSNPPSAPTVRPVEPAIPRSHRFTDTCNFDIRDAVFDDGTITFKVKVQSAGENVQVVLQNAAIRQYFDSVKNYIWKLFGGKKTSCTITFEIKDRKCVPVSVDNCELLQLDETILQRIHEGWVGEVLLAGDRDDILPLDDLIDPIKDETHNGETVFNHLVQEPKTKHYHHLRYLSARQAIDLQKLSITGKPMSFVFVMREKENIFLVWETYLTKEATYIWKLSAADDIVKKCGLIQEMHKAKRMLYRTKKEDGFSFIVHDYKQPMNGFHKWKEELEKIIL